MRFDTSGETKHTIRRRLRIMSADHVSEPSPKVGQEDGDEQQTTDEERLKDEIAMQKELIGALPSDTTDEIQSLLRMKSHQKKLGQLELQYQLLVEQKRLARELSKFEEIHGAIYSEPCLLCLNDIHVHASEGLYELFFCCGGFICKTCARDVKKSAFGLGKCPLCRESIAKRTVAEDAASAKVLAKRGVTWAQIHVGEGMIDGRRGFKKQEKAGLVWINKAADQQYPAAMFCLSKFYRYGLPSVLRKSQEKANELLLKAANLGYSLANSQLANFQAGGEDGFERDVVEAYSRASIAFALDENNGTAFFVGEHHYHEDIPEPSPYLACYYLNIATASENISGTACYLYSRSLHKLSQHLHDGLGEIPGSNVVPAVFSWLRKSHYLGYSHALVKLKEQETRFQCFCGSCGKDVQPGTRFKHCSKCRAQWYCSKECQVEAWRAGHRNDCKRAGILKFEDYLNAE